MLTSSGSAWRLSWGCLVSGGQEPLPLLSHPTHFQLRLCTFCRRLTEWGLLPNGQKQTLLDKVLPAPAWWCSPRLCLAVYLYGEAAREESRKALPTIRAGEYEALPKKVSLAAPRWVAGARQSQARPPQLWEGCQ